MNTGHTPTLFLDRDGTVNVDLGTYVTSPAEIELIRGVGLAIVKAQKLGFKIAIVTNQAGVAKGLVKKEAIPEIHRKIEELIAREAGVKEFRFDDIQVCPHHPTENCACRKPQTKMLFDSADRLRSDLARSYFIGDKLGDIQCANRGGVRPILVLTGYGRETELTIAGAAPVPDAKPFQVLPDAVAAVEWILGQQG